MGKRQRTCDLTRPGQWTQRELELLVRAAKRLPDAARRGVTKRPWCWLRRRLLDRERVRPSLQPGLPLPGTGSTPLSLRSLQRNLLRLHVDPSNLNLSGRPLDVQPINLILRTRGRGIDINVIATDRIVD